MSSPGNSLHLAIESLHWLPCICLILRLIQHAWQCGNKGPPSTLLLMVVSQPPLAPFVLLRMQRASSFIPVEGPFGPPEARKKPVVPRRQSGKPKPDGESNNRAASDGDKGSAEALSSLSWTEGRTITLATKRHRFS